MPRTKTKPPLEHTHIVARNLIHNGSQYLPGKTITFEDDVLDADIQELLDNGTLAGAKADELAKERDYMERLTNTHGPTDEEMAALWKQFNRQPVAARVDAEKREARIKETSEGARMANIDESRARKGPPEEDEGEQDEPEEE